MARSVGAVVEAPDVRIASGASATSSAACWRIRSLSPAPQRYLNPNVAAGGPAQLLQPLRNAVTRASASGSSTVSRLEHANAPHALALLRACGERPRRRAADKRDELSSL